MTQQRFFLPPTAIQNGQIHFPPETARQLRDVLRAQPGTQLTVCDGNGMDYQVTLHTVNRQNVLGEIIHQQANSNEPATQVTLFQGLLKKDKFEWVLQKAVEIGAAGFVPVQMTRSVVEGVRENKLERWERICREAAEQSQRGRVPHLAEPIHFAEALRQWKGFDVVLIPSLAEQVQHPLQMGLPRGGKIALIVGPEGGFDPRELQQALAVGARPVTLGKRILRAETAALVALSLTLAACGEL